jgi:hypothetical protein
MHYSLLNLNPFPSTSGQDVSRFERKASEKWQVVVCRFLKEFRVNLGNVTTNKKVEMHLPSQKLLTKSKTFGLMWRRTL